MFFMDKTTYISPTCEEVKVAVMRVIATSVPDLPYGDDVPFV